MSDNKKYYYMKLKENFFDTEEMIILESMQDGYLYSNILMKLYLRSLKDEGRLMFRGVIPYTPDALASVVRHNVGVVEKAIKVFQQFGLIEILDNGAIFMTDLQNFIGQSSSEGDRKRESRKRIDSEKARLLKPYGQMSGQMSGQTSDVCPPELEIELEKEIEKREKEKKARFTPPTLHEVLSYIAEKGLHVDGEHFYEYFSVGDWIDSKGNKVRNWKQKIQTWEKHSSGSSKVAKTGQAAYRNEPNYAMQELTAEELSQLPRG